ncbi:TniQ family protein [Dyella dinghuensis]|nr:TniQ family protein [Dyella dinghuensis]
MINLSNPTVIPHHDETLSSWLMRWAGDRHTHRSDLLGMVANVQIELADALKSEPDFPSAPGWARSLATVIGMDADDLDRIAWPPSPWVLAPDARCSACVECLGEDGDITAQYMRQLWTDSWRTLCLRHDLPLVQVPAFGWGWGLVGNEVRRAHKTLMRRPYTLVKNLRSAWEATPSVLKEAVYGAEMSLLEAFGEHYTHAGKDGHAASGRLRVWEDLLVVCTTNWQPWSDELPISAAVPTLSAGRRFFRGLRAPPFEGDHNLIRFRSLEDPSIRRMALACVADALQNMASRPTAEPLMKGKARKIWQDVATVLPPNAWDWLSLRAEQWPTTWRHWVLDWRRAALVSSKKVQ